MSLAAMADIWEHSKATHGSLLLMLAMADTVDRSNPYRVCWAGPTYLAKQARLNVDHVTDLLKDLATSGELIKIRHGDLDLFALEQMESATGSKKLGTSSLYILCPGLSPRTTGRWCAELTGGEIPPVKTTRGKTPGRAGGTGGGISPAQ